MDFDKIWEDVQWRFESISSKAHVFAKSLSLYAIIFFAFFVREFGFIRIRGTNDLEDIFNLGMTDTLASSSGLLNYFQEGAGSAVFPGYRFFTNFAHYFLGVFGLTFTLQTLFTLSGPFFASLTAYATYLLGKELKDDVTGLVSAAIISLIPGFFSISVDGRAANAVAGTFFLVLGLLFFVRSLKSNGVSALYYAILSGVSYAVLSSLWSGYIFMLILLSSYVAVLMFLNRINTSVYRAFTVFYLTGTGLSLLLPSVFGFRGPFYLEQFPGIAVFVLLQIPHYAPNLRGLITPIGGVASIVFVGAAVLGILSPSKGFSIFLYQLTSAQGSNWVTFFRDLHLILFLFPAGVVFLFRKRNDVNLFFILYALLALLLSSVSTHFTPVLYPVASVLGSLALTATLRSYLRYQDTPVKKRAAGKPVPKEIAFAVLAGVAAILGLFIIYSFSAATHPTVFRPVTTQPIVSQTTNQVKLMDDLREAHTWLRHNTPASSKILSWKGQGQHLAAFARSSILGADLENPQNLDKVSKALQSDEATAAQIMKELGADYLLVIFGGSTGYNDDLNRLHEITPDGQFNPTDSVLFKLSYKGFAEQYTRHQAQPGFDLLRRQQISYRPTLSHFDEVFTSEHWIVRIYKLRENVDSGKQEAEGNWQE